MRAKVCSSTIRGIYIVMNDIGRGMEWNEVVSVAPPPKTLPSMMPPDWRNGGGGGCLVERDGGREGWW